MGALFRRMWVMWVCLVRKPFKVSDHVHNLRSEKLRRLLNVLSVGFQQYKDDINSSDRFEQMKTHTHTHSDHIANCVNSD